jgi:ATP-dependent Clp protease protease subunit
LRNIQGKNSKKIERDTDRDFWLTADEAKTYGVVDHILKSPKK